MSIQYDTKTAALLQIHANAFRLAIIDLAQQMTIERTGFPSIASEKQQNTDLGKEVGKLIDDAKRDIMSVIEFSRSDLGCHGPGVVYKYDNRLRPLVMAQLALENSYAEITREHGRVVSPALPDRWDRQRSV